MSDANGNMFTLVVPSPTGPSQKINLRSDGTFESSVGDRHEINESSSLLIGSAEGNDIRREDATISRYHAELRFDNSAREWTIADLGSSNGTLLVYTDEQKQEYREPVPTNRFVRLKDYERGRIEVGSLTIRMRYNRAKPSQEAGAPAEPFLLGAAPAEPFLLGAAPAESFLLGAAPAEPSAAPQPPPGAPIGELAAPYLAVRRPSGWQQNVALTSTTFSIGAALNNDLPLGDDPAISPYHALLVYEGRAGAQAAEGPGWYLLDLGSQSGTIINNQPIEVGKRKLLNPEQAIMIGGVQIRYRQDRERWYVQAQARGREMREIDLSDSPFTIGSAPDNDYTLDRDESRADGDTSPYHTQLIESADGWAIRNLGSRIGTRVNSQLISPFVLHLLREHSQFTIGTTTFVVMKRAWQALPSARKGLGIQLDTATLCCAIGEMVTATLEVTSDIDSTVDLDADLTPIDGDPAVYTPSWISLTSRQLRLSLGKRNFTEIALQIPRDPTLAGSTYALTVTGRTNGAIAASAQARLEIQPQLEQPEEQAEAEHTVEQPQRIGLKLRTPALRTTPGQAVESRLEVSSDVADELEFAIVGPVKHWATFEPPSVQLAPGKTKGVQLSILPPEQAETLGVYNFQVIARGQAASQQVVEAELAVTAPPQVRLGSQSLTVAVGQTITCDVTVTSNVATDDIVLLSVEPEQPVGAWASFSEPRLSLTPHATRQVQLSIAVPGREMGSPGNYPLRVVAAAYHGGRADIGATLSVLKPEDLRLELEQAHRGGGPVDRDCRRGHEYGNQA